MIYIHGSIFNNLLTYNLTKFVIVFSYELEDTGILLVKIPFFKNPQKSFQKTKLQQSIEN